MRQLIINGQAVELSEKTAIGYDLQTGDLSDPVKRRFNVTNSFSIPKTASNRKLFEFCENPFSTAEIQYSQVTVDYYDSNIELIKGAKGYISEVGDNYQLTIVKDGNLIDTLKDKKLRELMREGFSSEGSFSQSLDFETFVRRFTSGIYYGTRGVYVHGCEYAEHLDYPNPKLWDGHLFISIKKIFEYIEDFTGYSLIISDTITDLVDFDYLRLPFYDLIFFSTDQPGFQLTGLYLYDDLPSSGYDSEYIPASYDFYKDVSVLDLIKALSVMFCAQVNIDSQTKEIRIVPMTTIVEDSAPINWSGKTIDYTKHFNFGSYGQTNQVDYELDTDVMEGTGRTVFMSNNVNLQTIKQFKINALAPRYITYSSSPTAPPIPLTGSTKTISSWNSGMFTDNPLKKMTILKLDSSLGTVGFFMKCAFWQSGMINFETTIADVAMTNLAIFNYSGYYQPIEDMLTNPVRYEATMNLNGIDIQSFKPYKLVKVDELGGVFYVNKITGYNSSSKKGTKVELIKVR